MLNVGAHKHTKMPNAPHSGRGRNEARRSAAHRRWAESGRSASHGAREVDCASVGYVKLCKGM